MKEGSIAPVLRTGLRGMRGVGKKGTAVPLNVLRKNELTISKRCFDGKGSKKNDDSLVDKEPRSGRFI